MAAVLGDGRDELGIPVRYGLTRRHIPVLCVRVLVPVQRALALERAKPLAQDIRGLLVEVMGSGVDVLDYQRVHLVMV